MSNTIKPRYFEYISISDENRITSLNELGSEGWEMVSAVYKPHTGITVFHLKREISEPKKKPNNQNFNNHNF